MPARGAGYRKGGICTGSCRAGARRWMDCSRAGGRAGQRGRPAFGVPARGQAGVLRSPAGPRRRGRLLDPGKPPGLAIGDGRVSGVRIQGPAGVADTVTAELVVDATGQGGTDQDVAGGAWLRGAGRGADRVRPAPRQPVPADTAGRPARRPARDRRPGAGPSQDDGLRHPGRRPLAANPGRDGRRSSRPRGAGVPVLRRDRRASGGLRGHPGRRTAQRADHPPDPGERPASLRTTTPIPGRAARLRRRHLQLQPRSTARA